MLTHPPQVVQARGKAGIARSKQILLDPHRALGKGARLRLVRLPAPNAGLGHDIQCLGGREGLGAVGGLSLCEQLPGKSFRLAVVMIPDQSAGLL
jgi:hypothetical protein